MKEIEDIEAAQADAEKLVELGEANSRGSGFSPAQKNDFPDVVWGDLEQNEGPDKEKLEIDLGDLMNDIADEPKKGDR